MAQTPEEYYNVENGHLGNYQYLKLSEMIDKFVVLSHDNESHLFGIPKHLLTLHAKSALKDLHRHAAKDYKALELSLGNDYVFPLPQDFVDYLRVSVVTANNTLAPLDINSSLNTAITYLQDNDYKLLFDTDGNVIEADGNNLTNKPYRSFNVSMTGNGGKFQQDTSKFSKNGEFVINQREGVIYFGSNLAGKDIVLEYISDGVDWERIKATDITFHKHLREALDDLMYHRCIERRKNVPYNEKERAKRQCKSSLHQAKVKMANFDLHAIEKVWRKGAKWVKT